MPNLFAACRMDGELLVKRVRLNAAVQQAVIDLFEAQERDFRAGVTTEVPFTGNWNPDPEEILTIDVPQEAQVFEAVIRGNATAVPNIDTGRFMEEGIKALFTGRVQNGDAKVLVQRFTSQQVLSRHFSLFQEGNAFRRLTETAFTLDSKLTCIIEGGLIKFKSVGNLRSIVDMIEIYREATNQEVVDFASHTSLHVANVQHFLANTNQTCRKLIHAISDNHVLNSYTPAEIQTAAQSTSLTVNITNGRISMPADGAGIKELLQFLNESRYSGPLSHRAYVTNSQRPA